jgi:hypothetical protein
MEGNWFWREPGKMVRWFLNILWNLTWIWYPSILIVKMSPQLNCTTKIVHFFKIITK